MLSNFVVSVQAVLPIFILIAIGYFIKIKGMVTVEEARKMNKVVFNFGFPCLMFSNLYGKSLAEAFNGKLLIYGVTALMVVYFLDQIFVRAIEKDPKNRGAMIQAIYRSNFVIMGLPVVSNMFGTANLGSTAIMITVGVPMFNILAVITLEMYRGGKVKPIRIILSIFKNPMVVGAIVGIIVSILKIELPTFAVTSINWLANIVTPMSLLLLGMCFDFSSVNNNKKQLIICVVGRLIVVPVSVLAVACLLGFRDLELAILIAMFATPCAIGSFTMAQQMDSNDELAGNAVIFASLFSVGTLFLIIFTLKCLGMC